jgi:hypothetical protein
MPRHALCNSRTFCPIPRHTACPLHCSPCTAHPAVMARHTLNCCAPAVRCNAACCMRHAPCTILHAGQWNATGANASLRSLELYAHAGGEAEGDDYDQSETANIAYEPAQVRASSSWSCGWSWVRRCALCAPVHPTPTPPPTALIVSSVSVQHRRRHCHCPNATATAARHRAPPAPH